jgi:DNA ligase-1
MIAPDAPSPPAPSSPAGAPGTLLADVVATAATVAATRSRKAKWAALAALLGRLQRTEVAVAVGLLAGEPRQGRIGVGWAQLAAHTSPLSSPAPASAQAPAPVPAPLTVLDLDRALDALQATTGPGSQERRQALLADLFARASAAERDFIVRVLSGGLRQGALAGVIAEAVAQAAKVPPALLRRAHMLSGNLGQAAELALAGGTAALEAVGLQVGRPLEPMLAASAETLEEALAELGGPAQVEWKLDGIRIQVHRRGGEVGIYTRNLNDITARLPEIARLARTLPAESFVLDGECLTLDENERPRLFQHTMSQLGREDSPAAASAAGTGTAGAWFFDVLHCDGRDLIEVPLAERRRVLEALVGAFRIPALQVPDDSPAPLEEARAFQQAALSAGHEGILVKALDSPYQAGRRGSAWIKVKPARTLDLVVLGAEWGHGRRQGWLSNLHLGARDTRPGATGGFVMVGKTFKGLTDAALREQTEAFLAMETGRRGIAVMVRPERVLEIELDGVQISTRYPGGVALRFARVKRIRHDKRADQADTLDAVRALLAGGGDPAGGDA